MKRKEGNSLLIERLLIEPALTRLEAGLLLLHWQACFGLSCAAVGARLGVSANTIQNWRANGASGVPARKVRRLVEEVAKDLPPDPGGRLQVQLSPAAAGYLLSAGGYSEDGIAKVANRLCEAAGK